MPEQKEKKALSDSKRYAQMVEDLLDSSVPDAIKIELKSSIDKAALQCESVKRSVSPSTVEEFTHDFQKRLKAKC